MRAVLDFGRCPFHKSKVDLVNQGGTLESMVGSFLLQVILSDPTQFFIHKGDKGAQGFLIPCSPFAEKGADRPRWRVGHTHTLGWAGEPGLVSQNNVRHT